MNNVATNRRKGVAIVAVLAFSVAILGLLTVLAMNTRSQRLSHSLHFEDSQALLAAKSATQLALYKFRVLPREYYRIHEMEIMFRTGELTDSAMIDRLNKSRLIWLNDLQSNMDGSPAARIKAALDASMGAEHAFGVTEVTLVSSRGYTVDYLRIRSWGEFGQSRKEVEELFEVKVVRD